tara:strand:- start:560 stop:1198 length:639 start_codon:yes stop_codon:yes gene_type:complete
MGKNVVISFSKALEVLKKYRYRARREWSKDERVLFKICNFIVLSKKRINRIFEATSSFGKLSDKSHYNYSEYEILQIKELILENLERCFQKFNKQIKILKDSDIQDLFDHLDKLKEENIRLQKENERLQFLIKNYLREEKFLNNKVLTDITKRKIIDKNKSRNEDVKLDKKSVKRFIEKWEKGMTSSEIVRELKAENLFLKNEKKKGFKLYE